MLRRLLPSKWHSQLPLNPRELRILLDQVVRSFRIQLDRGHSNSSPLDRPTKSSTAAARRSRDRVSAQEAAATHVSAVLSNPLFSSSPLLQRSTAPVHTGGTEMHDIRSMKQVLEHPHEWLQARIASGSGTVAQAETCLESLLRPSKATESSAARTVTQEQHVQATTILLNWIWATNQLETEEFLRKERLAWQLGFLLASAQRDDVVMRWIQAPVHKTGDHLGRIHLRWKGALTAGLVFHAVADDPSGGSALRRFNRALSTVAVEVKRDEIRPTGFQPAANVLLQHFAFNHNPARKDARQYDLFIANMSRIFRRPELNRALLLLLHPVHPDLEAGQRFLLNMDQKSSDTMKRQDMEQEKAAALSLGVAALLLDHSRFDEATEILDIARRLVKIKREDSRKDLQNSMNVLDTLLNGKAGLGAAH